MNAQTKKRLSAVAALALAAVGLGWVAMGNIGDNLVYYWTPTELLSRGEEAIGPTIRLGGVVKAGSVVWDADKATLTFDCQQDHEEGSPFVRVVNEGVPPQMFRDGIGVVVEGTWSASNTFQSSRLMVNHSNEYRGEDHPEVTDDMVAPEGMIQQPQVSR